MRSYDDWKTSPDFDDPTYAEAQCDSCLAPFEYLPELDADEDGVFAAPAPDLCPHCESTIVKVCGCGRRYSPEGWARLVFAFYMHDEELGLVEYRHCPCRSTIGIVVTS